MSPSRLPTRLPMCLASLLLLAALLALSTTGCALWHRGPTHKAVDELESKQQHSAPKQEVTTKRTGLIQRTEIRSSSYP